MDANTIINFIIMGILGSFLSILRTMRSWSDIKKFSYNRRLVSGAIIAYLYFFAVNEHGFPDQLVTAAIAYTGTDLFERIIEGLIYIYRRGGK